VGIPQFLIPLIPAIYFVFFSPLQREDDDCKNAFISLRLTIITFDAIKIPLPPLEVQTQIVEEIEKLEKNKSQLLKEGMSMKDFENVIKETKQAILEKYL
jgi:restriction endonuclease S subunit